MAHRAALNDGLTRRVLLCAALSTLALRHRSAASAESRVPIADMHSHFGIIMRRNLASADFAEELRAERVALIAWSLPSDGLWIRGGANGIEQVREPGPGELRAFFRMQMERMKAYVASSGLRPVLTGADVDACLAGETGVVLASEGADFLEGRVEDLTEFTLSGCATCSSCTTSAIRSATSRPCRQFTVASAMPASGSSWLATSRGSWSTWRTAARPRWSMRSRSHGSRSSGRTAGSIGARVAGRTESGICNGDSRWRRPSASPTRVASSVCGGSG